MKSAIVLSAFFVCLSASATKEDPFMACQHALTNFQQKELAKNYLEKRAYFVNAPDQSKVTLPALFQGMGLLPGRDYWAVPVENGIFAVVVRIPKAYTRPIKMGSLELPPSFGDGIMEILLNNSIVVKDNLQEARVARDSFNLFKYTLPVELLSFDVKATGKIHMVFRVDIENPEKAQVKIEQAGGGSQGDTTTYHFVAKSSQPAGKQSGMVAVVIDLLPYYKIGETAKIILSRRSPVYVIKVGQAGYTQEATPKGGLVSGYR